MRIVTWNVNGLRSLDKNGLWDAFFELAPDVIFLQETKAEESQLIDAMRKPAGYATAAFNSCRVRKGYSGVALYSIKPPDTVDFDVLPDDLNTEGRLIQAIFGDTVVIGAYFPNSGRGPERLDYKLRFCDALLEHIEKLRKGGPSSPLGASKSIIFCGDINIAHHDIDVARPGEWKGVAGFLPEEREWLDQVEHMGYVDAFRHFYPTKAGAYTYWDSWRGMRERNIGWRLDYFFVSSDLVPKMKRCEIEPLIFGSDHCPVVLDIEI